LASLIKGSLSGFSRSGEWNEPEGFYTQITSIRPLEEAKVSSGGVDMTEIKPNFECKNIQNLYFIWETLDIIGETWWFNLQRARSSGAICGQNL
jgi:predicted flavoprotein YhiN